MPGLTLRVNTETEWSTAPRQIWSLSERGNQVLPPPGTGCFQSSDSSSYSGQFVNDVMEGQRDCGTSHCHCKHLQTANVSEFWDSEWRDWIRARGGYLPFRRWQSLHRQLAKQSGPRRVLFSNTEVVLHLIFTCEVSACSVKSLLVAISCSSLFLLLCLVFSVKFLRRCMARAQWPGPMVASTREALSRIGNRAMAPSPGQMEGTRNSLGRAVYAVFPLLCCVWMCVSCVKCAKWVK